MYTLYAIAIRVCCSKVIGVEMFIVKHTFKNKYPTPDFIARREMLKKFGTALYCVTMTHGNTCADGIMHFIVKKFLRRYENVRRIF